MRCNIFLLFVFLSLPICLLAQDDLYFVPTKKNVEKSARDYGIPSNTYYSGIDRSVDEYNRRGSYVEQLDSAGNDVITFSPELGVYPDSAIVDDYEYTRRMARFDDYDWADAYSDGYRDGYTSAWGWNDPWYYNSWYYGGWYGSWHYPWRYGWYSGWYDPWYRPYWHYGLYSRYPVVVHRTYRGVTGTSNHGRVNRGGNYNSSGRFNGYRGSSDSQRSSTSIFGGQRNSNTSSHPVQNNSYKPSNSFGGNRNTSASFGGTRSSSGGGSSRGGGSFGGRR